MARTIYASEIPVISAVGHEPDVTIADFVADLRAATPSNAAELAVPDQNEIYANLAYYEDKLMGTMEVRLDRAADWSGPAVNWSRPGAAGRYRTP